MISTTNTLDYLIIILNLFINKFGGLIFQSTSHCALLLVDPHVAGAPESTVLTDKKARIVSFPIEDQWFFESFRALLLYSTYIKHEIAH